MTEGKFPKQEVGKVQGDALSRLLANTESISAWRGKELSKIFSNAESIHSFIADLNEANFLELLNSINGILRNKDRKDWEMDGAGIALRIGEVRAGYTPPPTEDHPMLFSQVLQAMKGMVGDGRDLNDVAILLSSSINAIHAYADANGRTSRLFYLLLTQGFSEEKKAKFKRALSEGGEDGREMIDINPEKIEIELEGVLRDKINFKRAIGFWESERNRKDIAFNDDLPESLKTKLIEMLLDESYSSIALQKFLNEEPDAEKYLKYYPATKRRGKEWAERNNIKVDDLFKDINEEQARRILSIYREIKIEMIHLLIDCIAHPEKEDYINNEGLTILEKFRREIARNAKIE